MIDYSVITFNGDYDINEDEVRVCDFGNIKCFILADGLGGQGKGDIASTNAVKFAVNFLSKQNTVNESILQNCFSFVHNRIKDLQEKNTTLKNMRTTLNILVIENDIAYWAHSGDSRLYYFKKIGSYERTIDHSVTQMLVDMGEIKKKDIRRNSIRNELVSAIGMDTAQPIVNVHVPVRLKKGSGFLICSDGFWEWIEGSSMKKHFYLSTNSKSWLDKMLKIVKKKSKKNKMDNYSAIAIKIK